MDKFAQIVGICKGPGCGQSGGGGEGARAPNSAGGGSSGGGSSNAGGGLGVGTRSTGKPGKKSGIPIAGLVAPLMRAFGNVSWDLWDDAIRKSENSKQTSQPALQEPQASKTEQEEYETPNAPNIQEEVVTPAQQEAEQNRANIAESVRAWLADDGWLEAGEEASRVALGDEAKRGAGESWAQWDEAGRQLSTRIVSNVSQGSSHVRQVARFYAVCWEKAKMETAPTSCAKAFNDHAIDAVKYAVGSLVLEFFSRGSLNASGRSAAVKAAYDAMRATFTDSRCDMGEMERHVYTCVDEMHKGAYEGAAGEQR